jgi:hypothetical protein
MERAVTSGYGIKIDYYNVTTESITWALQEILESPKYVLRFLLIIFVLSERPVRSWDKIYHSFST